MLGRGCPAHIRSDNGPEFIARVIGRWLSFIRIGTIYIAPGSLRGNPSIESFNGRSRDERLNRERFGNVLQAQMIVEEYRREYDEERLYSALGYKTPAEFARCSRVLGA